MDISLRTGDFSEAEQEYRADQRADDDVFRKALGTGKIGVIDDLLKTFLRLSGYELFVPPEEYKRLAYAFLQSYVKSRQTLRLRDEGEIVETSHLAPESKLLPTPEVFDGRPGATYKEIYDCWLKATVRLPKTADEYRRIWEEVEAFLKRKRPTTIVKKDLIAFKDHLLAKPQSGKTIEKKIGVIRTIFRTAVDNDLVDSNPVDGVRIVLPKVSKKSRIAFPANDLVAIFSSPVYSQNLRPKAGGGEASYWLPLIACFSGARIEEIAQLLKRDIKEEPGHGHYFHITDEADHSRVKTRASRRRVPVHRTLIDLGFLQYVESLPQPDAYLFSNLKNG